MSSNIQNVISTVFTARSGQALAAMRQYGSGLTQIGGNMQQTARHSNVMNQQMRALGTTLRYAFAGSVVFGAASMARELQNIQGQLALMQAVGDVTTNTGKSIAITGDVLNKWQDEVAQKAPKVLTSTTDMNDAIVNLLSSVDKFKASEVVPSMEKFATGANIAQTTVEQLVTGVTQMNTAFGQDNSLKNYTSIVESFVEIVRKVPGGRAYGQQFLLQLPQLAAQAKLAGATPEEMLATYMTTARVLPPAVAGRGLGFAFLSLFKPGNKDAAAALSGLGITPELLTTPGPGGGPVAAFRKIFAKLQPGSREALTGMLKTGITEEQAEEDPTETLRGLGIKGADLTLLSSIFTRIHGLRAFAAIAGQKGSSGATGGQLEDDLKMIHEVYQGIGTESKEVRKAFEDFNKMQPLKEFAMTMVSLRTQVERDLAPMLNYPAEALSTVVQKGLGEHTEWPTRALAAGGAGAVIWRMLKKGKGLPKGLGPAAIGAASLGNEGLGASPLNPMFVIVVGQMFGPGGTGLPGWLKGKGGGAAGEAAEDAAKMGRWGKFKGLFSKVGKGGAMRWGGRALKIGGPMAIAAAILEPLINPDTAGAGSDVINPVWHAQHQAQMRNLRRAQQMQIGGPGNNVLQLYRAQTGSQKMFGKATVDVDVLIRHPDGKKERKTYHVPMDIWQGGPTPGNRGKAGAKR